MATIFHETHHSYYQYPSKDPFGPNTDADKVSKIQGYAHKWRTKDSPLTTGILVTVVIDHFSDHNIGGIGMFIMNESKELQLKVLVGLKKYTKDPSSKDSTLFSHSYGYLGDVEDGNGKIIRLDVNALEMTRDVNVYKMKHYKKKLEDNESIELFPPVKEGDTEKEKIKVWKSVFIPFILMRLVLDKDLSPWNAFLLLEATITAGKIICCEGILGFIPVAGTMPVANGTPFVSRDTSGPSAGISVNRPLIKITRVKVMESDLKGTRKSMTRSDPMLKQLANTVTTFTDIHLQRDAANEEKTSCIRGVQEN